MNKLSRVPAVVWLLLCGLTILSVAMAEGRWLREISTIVVMLIAAAKARLVILHYMEATRAAKHWRFLYETWNFAAAATIIIGYLLGLSATAMPS
jgi:heme/copper-type cytochrome/quinol oxidase subunit 4